MQSVSVVGLGKLGQCFAGCFAKKSFRTIGVDIDEHVVKALNTGTATIIEPELQEIVAQCAGKSLFATMEHERAITETDVTFILVATPTDHAGNFSNKYVESALVELSKSLRKSSKNEHLFVISSTLMPTSIEKRIIPLIERHSGRRVNEGFSICYNPDFVALGNVVHGFLNPDFVLIGESNVTAGDRLVKLYERFCDNKAPIFRMNIVSAEIAKVSLNTYITMKISFANTLANICEKVPGAGVDAITRAIGTDKRISPYYLKGGLAYGGTCFPRDTTAFMSFARQIGYQAHIVEAIQRVNELQGDNLFSLVVSEMERHNENKVSILGAAFKPGTPVTTASPAIALIDRLVERGITVMVYDELATENVKQRYGEKVSTTVEIRDCFRHASTVVIAGGGRRLQNIDNAYLAHNVTTIIDCWRANKNFIGHKGVRYVAVGEYHENLAD